MMTLRDIRNKTGDGGAIPPHITVSAMLRSSTPLPGIGRRRWPAGGVSYGRLPLYGGDDGAMRGALGKRISIGVIHRGGEGRYVQYYKGRRRRRGKARRRHSEELTSIAGEMPSATLRAVETDERNCVRLHNLPIQPTSKYFAYTMTAGHGLRKHRASRAYHYYYRTQL